MPHEPGNIGRFAQIWISYDVQIRYASQADGLADAMATGFLNVTEQFGVVRDADSGEER